MGQTCYGPAIAWDDYVLGLVRLWPAMASVRLAVVWEGHVLFWPEPSPAEARPDH
jgi:hypothetical protein